MQGNHQDIKIAGKIVPVKHQKIDIYELEYDTDNPRIGIVIDTSTKQLPQEAMPFALKRNKAAYDDLKASIEANQGALYPIYVYPISKGKYKVIEGNTRLLIYRDLYKNDPSKNTFKKINCIVMEKQLNRKDIDFIRLIAHLRGTTDWDSYEKARYLYHLWQDEGYSKPDLKKNTKMSINEIEANIKAFEIMEEQYKPKYEKGDKKYVQRFSYFVEYTKDKKLQSLMEQNDLTIADFCKWVKEEKVTRAIDVRNIREFLKHPHIKERFLKEDYDAAMYELSLLRPEFGSRIYEDVKRVIEDLKKMPLSELEELSKKDNVAKLGLLIELEKSLTMTLKHVRKK